MILKKYGIYTILILTGIFLGFVFFGNEEYPKELTLQEMTNVEGWTCSMHPEIITKVKGQCPICGMELTSLISEGILKGNQFKISESAMALANVETMIVGQVNYKDRKISVSGSIELNEATNSSQVTFFDGRLDKVKVKVLGEYIKKGQKLGEIYSPELYLAQDKLLTSVSYKNTHQKLYDAARNTLGLWKMTDLQIDEIIKTGKPMMFFPLYADESGTVIEILAKEGSYYRQGETLYRLSNLNTVWAVFDVYENQISNLKVGQKVQIKLMSYPDQNIEAVISFIQPILNETKRTVSIRAVLHNKNGLLKPGMFIEGSIEINSNKKLITVPKSAVLWTGKRSLIYLKTDSDRPFFEMNEVDLGGEIGDEYIITRGLSEGQEVVINGAFTLDAAAQLQGKKSMMKRNMSPTLNSDKILNSFKLDIINTQELLTVIEAYMEVKKALIESNFEKTKIDTGKLINKLNLISSNAKNSNIKNIIENLTAVSKEIYGGINLNAQRKNFTYLSEDMEKLVRTLDNLPSSIYVQFCPMANKHDGGSWLSYDIEIENPYFGENMLNCGEIINTIE